MTTPEEFTPRLLHFISEEVARSDGAIEPGTDLLLTGLVDSLGVILIVDWMEEELSIAIDPVDVVLENFQTVRQMAAYAEQSGLFG